MNGWFEVDKQGLAAILERRGKSWAVYELVQNGWDSGSDRLEIRLEASPGEPYARLEVEDWGEGFKDFDHAHTMFVRSNRASDPLKRGRFNLGEKLVLACCRSAIIRSTGGEVRFVPDGTRMHLKAGGREQGTFFAADIRMTRDELKECLDAIPRLIPPVPTSFNGTAIEMPTLLISFETKLPTEVVDEYGLFARTVRRGRVEVYEPEEMGGCLLEMGVPIVELECPFRVNVLQKIPLNMERDSVTPAFLKAINAAVLNNVHGRLNQEEAAAPWAQEAAGDGRATPEAVRGVVTKRFGDRAVVASPGDPIANATAEQAGYTVVHGGAMSAEMWSNVRKHEVLKPAATVFPSPKPEALAKAAAEKCPVCGK
jgi:hypothetical protein